MKSLADAAFFRAFDGLASAGNAGLKRATWSFAGADWQRARHSFSCADYSFAVEVFAVTRAGRPAWRLIVVKEHWWAGPEREAVKRVQWARPAEGEAAAILAWLRDWERSRERHDGRGLD
jgi:hypothetical protein